MKKDFFIKKKQKKKQKSQTISIYKNRNSLSLNPLPHSLPKMSNFHLVLFFLLLCSLPQLPPALSRQPFACDPKSPQTRTFKFCRPHLPIHVRAIDLVSRFTLPEKIRLVVNNAIAVPRLGISGYDWWSEALHGVSNVGPGTKFGGDFPAATSFPQVISTAASFNDSLWEHIGQVHLFFFYLILSM